MPKAMYRMGEPVTIYRKTESGDFEEHEVPALYAHGLLHGHPEEWVDESSLPPEAKIANAKE
jgi:hypothetical protein